MRRKQHPLLFVKRRHCRPAVIVLRTPTPTPRAEAAPNTQPPEAILAVKASSQRRRSGALLWATLAGVAVIVGAIAFGDGTLVGAIVGLLGGAVAAVCFDRCLTALTPSV